MCIIMLYIRVQVLISSVHWMPSHTGMGGMGKQFEIGTVLGRLLSPSPIPTLPTQPSVSQREKHSLLRALLWTTTLVISKFKQKYFSVCVCACVCVCVRVWLAYWVLGVILYCINYVYTPHITHHPLHTHTHSTHITHHTHHLHTRQDFFSHDQLLTRAEVDSTTASLTSSLDHHTLTLYKVTHSLLLYVVENNLTYVPTVAL